MRSCWSLQLSRTFLLVVALPCFSFAQFIEPEGHAKATALGGYLFPINPGQPNQLAGTMGELRSTHFHGGIDIRTNNQIGVPVRATQDGYIVRAVRSTSSYGSVLLINHPDGKTSLYGHLDRFKGRLAEYVRQEEYNRKSFEIELNFNPGEFPVKKGDTIAFSGNSGSSAGPHLHFEIREGNYTLNPLKFGFTEIMDNIPPAAQKIALRTLDINSRINDRFGRFEFSVVKKSATEFSLPVPILAHGRIGVELLADDRMDNTPARCGINYIEMFADSEKVFSQYIERVDLDETRAILNLMDYKTLETRGKRFNKLYIDQGNRLNFYKSENEGVISVGSADRSLRISMKDEAGNKSNLRLRLKSMPLSDEFIIPSKKIMDIESDLSENVLTITSKICPDENLMVYYKDKPAPVKYTYKSNGERVYLLNLQKAQPDSVKSCGGTIIFHFKDVIPSLTTYTYYSDWADIRFPENSLYDTLFLNVSHRVENGKEAFVIGQRTIPLHKSVYVTLKPSFPQTPAKNLAVYRREGKAASYVGGEWSNGKVKLSTRELGEFIFLTDSVAPTITRIKLDRQTARLKIRDGLSGIAYYEANIDGQWLLMIYDYKSGVLQSEKLDNKEPLKGDFELKVVDRAGNERIFKQKIL